jgi:hypothetical protein
MKRSFKELSESEKWEMVDCLTGDDWCECIINDQLAELREIGFLEPDIEFTGFWSQGDGASFTCDGVDFPVLLKHLIAAGFQHRSPQVEAAEPHRDMAELIGWKALGIARPVLDLVYELGDCDLIEISIWRSGRYCHEMSTNVSVEISQYWDATEEERDIEEYLFTSEDQDEIEWFSHALDTFLSEWIVSKNRKIYSALEEEYTAIQESIWQDLENEEESEAA